MICCWLRVLTVRMWAVSVVGFDVSRSIATSSILLQHKVFAARLFDLGRNGISVHCTHNLSHFCKAMLVKSWVGGRCTDYMLPSAPLATPATSE